MASLNVWNYLSLVNDGTEVTAKHGTTTDDPQTPFTITVTGNVFQAKNTLGTATSRLLWASTLLPATFAYGHFWADQICYLQRITADGSMVDKVAAKQPFVFPGYSGCVPSGSTTPIAGGAEPTLAQIDSIVLGNYSGDTLNYVLSLIL